MQIDTKIVEFEKYCNVCKYWSTKCTEDPCNECLTSPTNINSRKPIMFEQK